MRQEFAAGTVIDSNRMNALRSRARPPKKHPPNNLPLELSSFIGREREVAEVKGLLAGRRLLTLTGPGGSGKTRLALAVAQGLVEGFEDGVWWVELASLSDPKLVPGALASALGVREVPDRSPTEVLVEHLKPRKTLLVLDNCEHLVEGCAALADALLRACPDLQILATSREPLRIAGEATWAVPSLSLPDPEHLPATEELARYEAVRLFVERAGAVNASFELTERNASAVARLCRKLDGIPLAVELAAARTRVLTVEQISEKLEDPLGLLTTGSRAAALRHQTLRATLQWSYELLSEQEQRLFERLSVFAGGWTLEATEAVGTGDPVEAEQVLDLLSTLVDKSLVVVEEDAEGGLRYRMLEPVRQYALERLMESGTAEETHRRHADYFLALAERADPELLGPDQGRWLQRLRTEAGNLRGALSWTLEPTQEEERAELRLRMVAAMGRFWGRENFEEGKRWLRTALEKDPGGFPVARAKALGELGFILLFQQDYGPAIAALDEAVALYKGLGDTSGAAFALANLGWAVLHGYYRERVLAFVREGEALIEGGLEDHPRAYLSIILASATVWQGNLDLAASRIKEAITMCRELGNLRDVAMALFNLGGIHLKRGDTDRAMKVFEEGARISGQLGDMLGAAYYIWIFGGVNARLGRPVRAARLWGAAEALREQMGMSFSRYDLTESGYEGDLVAVRSTLDQASFDAAWAEGRSMSFQGAIDYALGEPIWSDERPAHRLSPDHSPAEETGGGRRHNLTAALSSFVGRERVVPEVGQTLTGTQLLTLTGAGGCGKTRLALEVARGLVDDYQDGVWMVQLASLTEGDLVPDAVAAALGVSERPELSVTETLVEYLRSRHLLLVLDNCEHLIEASAQLVETLLSSCEHLHVLATSREALGIAGEVNWMVPSLAVPDASQAFDPQTLARYEAVELFVERARSRLPSFELTPENALAVVDVCRKLDGIPLAIELATARMGTLSVDQISERLADSLSFLTTGDRTKAPRHQTLRAALAWSHDLLSQPEKKLFGRLSVFAGGWDLEAAEAVGAGGTVEARWVLDLLSMLVGKSLVVVEASPVDTGALRYRMLEPVRQYALERLVEANEIEEARRRHAEFFAVLAEGAYPELRAEPQVEWLERLEKENGNLRGALSWALAAGNILTAATLGWSIWPFWWMHNYQPEGRRWLEMILRKKEELPLRLRIEVTIAAEAMAYGQRDGEAVERYAGELVELSREAGRDAKAEAYAHGGVGLVATVRGDLGAAMEHLEKALPLFRESGENGLAAQTLIWLGTVRLLQGNHEGASRGFHEGLAAGQRIGDRMSIHNALFNLAQLALADGDFDTASRRFAEGIAPSRELGDRGNIAHILEGLATVAGARGDADLAARLLGASEALISAIGLRGHTYYQFDLALYERINARVRATLGEAAFEAALKEGRAMSPEQALEYALEEPATPHEEETHPPAASADVLRIFALGPARVEKDGRPLPSSPDWIHKPRELLFYLLSHPEGRTKEQIGLALWPDASNTQLRSSFHDTVYRLRRAIGGKEWIVFEKGRYTLNHSLPYFFDVEAFEENLSEARRLHSEAPEQAIRLLQEAADLYGGDFLEDSAESEWALERQEELWREYRETLLLLGRLLYAQERYAEATEAYRKAISHDGLLEEAHRELMRSQAALGERGRALKHYEELVELLDERLGTPPAPETRALHERLRLGEEA